MVLMTSRFPVNRNSQLVTTCIFNRVHAVHNPMTGNGAAALACFSLKPVLGAQFRGIHRLEPILFSKLVLFLDCENPALPATVKEFRELGWASAFRAAMGVSLLRGTFTP